MDHQSLITIAPWTFIAQILNLLLQAWLFKKFLFQPVKKILAKRKEEVDGLYEQAENAKKAAEDDRAAYREKLESANAEAAEIVADARQAAQEKGEQMLAAAREETAAMKQRASADIELEKKKAVNEMKNELSSLAVQIAEKVTEQSLDEGGHAALIDSFLENLEAPK
ncbi:MAG: F0F1 ATP synthase subunit B [Oscillospiraceae bacterium]|nr:F0F1 ATP synthase subunit B [Oscillospiraceae bacterium]